MRKRFDDNKNIKDMRVAKELLQKGEEELFQKMHWQPKKCMIYYYLIIDPILIRCSF